MISQIKLPKSYVLGASPGGNRLVSLGRDVTMVDTVTRKRLWNARPFSHPSRCDFSPDRARLAIKGTSGQIVILDAETSELLADFKNRKDGEGSQALFSSCGDYLVDASWSGDLIVRKSETGQTIETYSHPGEMITRVSCCLDRQQWLFLHKPKTRPGEKESDPAYATLRAWPFGESVVKIKLIVLQVYGLSLSPDAKHVAMVGILDRNSDETLFILDVNGTVERFVRLPGKMHRSLRWSPDGKSLGVVDSNYADVFRASDLVLLSRLEGVHLSDIAFDPMGRFTAYGDWARGVILYNDADQLPECSQ